MTKLLESCGNIDGICNRNNCGPCCNAPDISDVDKLFGPAEFVGTGHLDQDQISKEDFGKLFEYNCGPDISDVVNDAPICKAHDVPMQLNEDEWLCAICEDEFEQIGLDETRED